MPDNVCFSNKQIIIFLIPIIFEQMMVIGQCMGAGKADEAKMYIKHILKMDYLTTIGVSVVFLFILPLLLGLFDVFEHLFDKKYILW